MAGTSGSPVVETSPFNLGGAGTDPCLGRHLASLTAKKLDMSRDNVVTSSIKDLKMVQLKKEKERQLWQTVQSHLSKGEELNITHTPPIISTMEDFYRGIKSL